MSSIGRSKLSIGSGSDAGAAAGLGRGVLRNRLRNVNALFGALFFGAALLLIAFLRRGAAFFFDAFARDLPFVFFRFLAMNAPPD